MKVEVNAQAVACGLGGCAAKAGQPCVNSVNQAPRETPHMNRLVAAVRVAAYRPMPHLDAVKADLVRAEQERDEALAGRKDAIDAFVRISDRLAAVREAAGRDIADPPDESLVDRVAELRRGRTEATQRALELAAELASARTELEQLRAELAQRTPTWPKVTTTTEGAPPE